MPEGSEYEGSTLENMRVCKHLLSAPEIDYHRRFTGKGWEYELVCAACVAGPATDGNEMYPVSRERLVEIEEAGWWDGIQGQPEIAQRASDLAFRSATVSIPSLKDEMLTAIQPIESSATSRWIAFGDSQTFFEIDLSAGTATTIMRLTESALDFTQPLSLHLDRSGRFAACVNTRGQRGVVVDLRRGTITMHLARDTYQVAHSSFPIAFFDTDGRTLLVHGTKWNRLDISDPAGGALLTPREYVVSTDNRHPEHHLDYFHCTLTVSPDQEWIADNGWVWSPVGLTRTWSLRRWLYENCWESEDGESVRNHCQRAYFWDGPNCWIDDRTFSLWGYGQDENHLLPAAWLFDARTGDEVRWFPGPSGSFFFDIYLFAASPEHGMSVWDIGTGERLLLDQNVSPTHYHRGARQFLALPGNGQFQISWLVTGSGS